jgi:hypothetical protein
VRCKKRQGFLFNPRTLLAVLDGQDPEDPSLTLRGEFFLLRGIDPEGMVIMEGKLRIVERKDIARLRDEFTPITGFVIDRYLDSTII